MFRPLVLASLTVVALVSNPQSALAETSGDEPFSPSLSVDYLWDGGALPFVYGSGLLTLGLRFFVDPPKEPRLFSPSEGGESVSSDTIPEAVMAGFALSSAGLIAGLPGEGRWYHLKGYAQAVLTTLAITEIAKNAVGRHRPTYEGDLSDLDSRRSFWSGHSSLGAAMSVYLGLYLGRNILPQMDPERGRLYKALGTVGLGAALVGIPLSRLKDNRHHLSDVLTGSLVGAATAVAFYAYQESRLHNERESHHRSKRSRFVVLPDIKNRGLLLTTSW